MSKLLFAAIPLASLLAGPRLPGTLTRINPDGGAVEFCPLKQTRVKGRIDGGLARVTVTQEFFNPSKSAIEAVYVFPLPENSAVDDMTLHVGDRTIRGLIKKRDEARKIYEQARNRGYSAALLDQERPNIFRQHVANIPPGAAVKIEISYVELMPYRQAGYEFVFPMVVGPRYKATERTTSPIPQEGIRAGHDIAIELDIDAGRAIRDLKVESHEVVSTTNGSRAQVKLRDGVTLPNKDFILRYSSSGDQVTDTVLAHRDSRGGFFTLSLAPPQATREVDVSPKEIVFVLDTSGSMMGFPIEKAKEAMRLAMNGLHPRDTFNLITFAGDTHVLFPEPVQATPENLKRAQEFLASRRGSGGTEMLGTIRAAMTPSRNPEAIRVVCFMTDGYIGYENEIFREIKKYSNARIFSFGIGQSVNRHLLDRMAEFGRGEVEYVTLESDGSAAAKRFHERVRSPLLTDVAIEWNGLPMNEVYPQRIPDLFDAKPLMVTGRYSSAARGTIRVTGKMAGRPFSRDIAVNLPGDANHDTIASLWARRKVAAIDDESTITQLGLDFRLMTQYTSFVAVEERVVNEGGKPRRIEVPIEMPEGVSHDGIFNKAQAVALGSGIAMPMARMRREAPEIEFLRADKAVTPAPSAERIHVMIVLKNASAEAIAKLDALGLERSDQEIKRLIFGYITKDKLEQIRKLSEVFSVLTVP